MVKTGFIMLYRDFVDWEWYTDVNTCKVFLHCLIKVNYSQKKWQGVFIDKGQFVTSYEKLAIETGLTISKVRTALSKLESTSDIYIETTTSFTKIGLLKIEDFISQSIDKENDKLNSMLTDKQNDRQFSSNSQTNDNQIATTNTNNNILNKKNRFREEVFLHSQFNIKILENFFEYWSELNVVKTKMRFEEEKFFEIKKRLEKWKANERTTKKNNKIEPEFHTNR